MKNVQTAGILILLSDPHDTLTLDMFTLVPVWPFSRIRLRSGHSRCSRPACFIHFWWDPEKRKKTLETGLNSSGISRQSAAVATDLKANQTKGQQVAQHRDFHEVSPSTICQTDLELIWSSTVQCHQYVNWILTRRQVENNVRDLRHTSDSARADHLVFLLKGWPTAAGWQLQLLTEWRQPSSTQGVNGSIVSIVSLNASLKWNSSDAFLRIQNLIWRLNLT